MSGVSGVSGVVVVGGGSSRPIGVSPKVERVIDDVTHQPVEPPWWRGDQWPPKPVPGPSLPLPTGPQWGVVPLTQYRRRSWDPYHFANTIVAEYVLATTSDPQAPKWDAITLPAIPTASVTADEIKELIALIEYRPAVLAEAMAQRNGFTDYYQGILSFDQVSHPYTCDLIMAALRVAEFTEMHYKRKFSRPRPSHITPALMPPIDPPGHASYPSGHATESRLVTLCLKAVMPQQAHEALDLMSVRVARNREVLGVHYPSDSRAGQFLAEQIFKLLTTCPTVQNELILYAKQEWGTATP